VDQETWQKLFRLTLSVNVDKKHKIIRKIVTGTASTADTCHFQNAFDPANTRRDVYADRGYPSKAREAWLKREGYRSQISSEGPKEQAPVRVPTPSEPQDIEVACSSRARVCRDRADGRQDGLHHRPSQGQFRDDDDGGLLQHEAACLLPENGDCSLLAPEIRLMTEWIGHQGEIRDAMD
jgi:hypothetical protein